MAEKIQLTKPFKPDPRQAVEWVVGKIILDWSGEGVHITLQNADIVKEVSYNGTAATALMNQLNKANLLTKSLHRRLLEKVQQDFPDFAGSITGAPD